MERPSSKSSIRSQQGGDQQTNPNVVKVTPVWNRQQAARGDSQSAAGGSRIAGESQSTAGGSRAAGDFQKAAEDPRFRRSERITSAALEEVSLKLDNLRTSKKPEGAKQVAKIERPHRSPGFASNGKAASPSKAATAAKRSAKPASEINSKILVMSAIEELKSRKGVSLVAIDKNIKSKLGAQAQHWRPYVRIYLRKALKTGKLVHVQNRKRKDGKDFKGLQGCFKPAVAARKSAAAKSPKKSTKMKKVAIKDNKTQVRRRKLQKITKGQRQRPTQRTR